jgi:TAP42-like family
MNFQVALRSFIRLLDDYEVILADDQRLHAAPLPSDPTKLRETKIAQYKAEKAVRSGVQVSIAGST